MNDIDSLNNETAELREMLVSLGEKLGLEHYADGIWMTHDEIQKQRAADYKRKQKTLEQWESFSLRNRINNVNKAWDDL